MEKRLVLDNLIPYGTYQVIGKQRFNSCTEYWLKNLEHQTSYVFKDKSGKLDYQSVVTGTKLSYEITIKKKSADQEIIIVANTIKVLTTT